MSYILHLSQEVNLMIEKLG